MVGDHEGHQAVRWARAAIEGELSHRRIPRPARMEADELPTEFGERRGVFVTLKRYPSGDLRGCIGFPMPVLPLGQAIARAAVAAALEDPRFPPVVADELPRLTIEVSVLSVPEPIPTGPPATRVAAVEVGRDGLIVDGYGTSGLLLPQVAPEQGWNAEELLEGACEKAGLPSDAWRDPEVRVRRFGAEIFTEIAPGGPVEREVPEVNGPSARPAR
jgi:uncharacterized protein